MTRVALHNSLAAPLSVTWNVAIQLPIVISFFIGGWLVHAATPTTIFILSAMILFAVLACAILGQRLVERSLIGSIHSTDRNAFRAVFRSGRRFWLAIAIIALFTFQPGWQTPLFFYVTSTIKMTSTEYGLFMALITAFTIIGNLLFFIVARRRSLITVLWFGTTSIVLQSPLPFLIDSAASGYAVAMISGLMYGFAIAGYWALLLSSSPVGLEGTAYTTAIAVSMMGTRFGDLFGSWLYQQVGFSIPIVLTTFIMTLIFPVIYLVSRHDSTSGTREALQAG
jgi:predicted MFS family arabinose efflux permease